MGMIFDQTRCPTYPTWRHPGLLTLGPLYPIYEHEKCRLIIVPSSYGNSFASLAICEVNPLVTSGPHDKGPVMFFVICKKLFTKNSRCTWFETPPRSCYIIVMMHELGLCGQFCDLIAIQYRMTQVHGSMRPVNLAPGWQVTFVPIEHFGVYGQSRPFKPIKN